MGTTTIMKVLCAGALVAACGDQTTSPSADRQDAAALNPQLAIVDVRPEGFTARAAIEPYFINQMPDLQIRSQVRADLAIQRLVTDPGIGGWHTHPGPSFAIVEKGRVMITRYSKKNGCIATVYGPGEPAGSTYYEEAGELHHADVLGEDYAVEYKLRFNTPKGAPFADFNVTDPGC
jgi:hypothetical protein